ncbi:MAG: hypothetical protein K8T90_09170 [Planctomycetes bacterium]|nr:hypothetical protein [Planctomycetota bacterium]
MNHTNPITSPRRRHAPFVLALGLLAILGPGARADGTPTRSQVPGYPRSSAASPGPLKSAPVGYGDDNFGTTGTQYDTNMIFDADPDDPDAVWMIVRQACITSGGLVISDDPSDSSREAQRAWGEDRVQFTVEDARDEDVAADRVVIVVRNELGVNASWTVEGSGRNHAVMDARLLDITGKTHGWARHVHVDPTVTNAASASSQETDEHDSGSQAGKSQDGFHLGAKAHERQSDVDGAWSSMGVTSVATASDADGWGTSVEQRYRARSCAVRIASSALLEVKAQANVQAVPTSSNVHAFDILNVVDASYVVDAGPPTTGGGGSVDPAGPTTPGGNTGGPTTPGGGNPGTPPTPGSVGGSAPGGAGGSTPGGAAPVPGTPSVPGSGTPPGDRPLPQQPGPVTPPNGGPSLPPAGAGSGTSGGAGGGSAPQGGSGTDVGGGEAGGSGASGGAASGAGGGSTGLPRGDGSSPAPTGQTPSGDAPTGGALPGGTGTGFEGGTRPGETPGSGFSGGGGSATGTDGGAGTTIR